MPAANTNKIATMIANCLTVILKTHLPITNARGLYCKLDAKKKPPLTGLQPRLVRARNDLGRAKT
jgi:hypothetical protein